MSTWLTAIVINSAWMQLRKRSRHIQVSLDELLGEEEQNFGSERIADERPSPEDVCRESELHERVSQLLTRLSAPLRKAFQLRDLDGLTTHEAAIILGVPEGTVKAQLARARASLRQLMRGSRDTKSSSAPLHTSVPVMTIGSRRSRQRVTSAARNQDRRLPARCRTLSGRIPASLEAGWKVA